MHTGKGKVLELILRDEVRYVHLTCAEKFVPAPGQYLLAHDQSDALLPAPIFFADSAPHGFIGAAPIPDSWSPGRELHLRGPIGKGFSLPGSARRVGLVALAGSPARLHGLIQSALHQDASVVLVSDLRGDDLPDQVEVQPVSALPDILTWADYIAVDAAREKLQALREHLIGGEHANASFKVQVLVRTLVPCGGIADCGVCAVSARSGWKMACKDGPVFDWRELE